MQNRISDISLWVVGASKRTNWIFVKVTSDDGRHGWGEATLIGHERLVVAAIEGRRSELIGLAENRALALLAPQPHDPGGPAFCGASGGCGSRSDRHPLGRIRDGHETATCVALVPSIQAIGIIIDFLPHATTWSEPHDRIGRDGQACKEHPPLAPLCTQLLIDVTLHGIDDYLHAAVLRSAGDLLLD
jgi:hypothetical protein